MPYTVDNAFFQARAAESARRRETLRHSLGLERGRPIILYAGKLMPRKRPDDLLKCLSADLPGFAGRTAFVPALCWRR